MGRAEDLAAALDSQIELAGESLSISRGGFTSENFDGIFGTPTSPVSGGDTVVTSRESSFIIRRMDYAPAGEASEPRIGDRITRIDTGEVYDVARPDAGGPHFEKYGGLEYGLRVFAQRVST